jgi:hypothetical protein
MDSNNAPVRRIVLSSSENVGDHESKTTFGTLGKKLGALTNKLRRKTSSTRSSCDNQASRFFKVATFSFKYFDSTSTFKLRTSKGNPTALVGMYCLKTSLRLCFLHNNTVDGAFPRTRNIPFYISRFDAVRTILFSVVYLRGKLC